MSLADVVAECEGEIGDIGDFFLLLDFQVEAANVTLVLVDRHVELANLLERASVGGPFFRQSGDLKMS